MERDQHLQKLAKKSGKPDSEVFYKILECAMTGEEARFLLEMPASSQDLGAKFNMGEDEVEQMILNLSQRGLLSRSPFGPAFPNIPAILHDNILSSAEQHIPDGIDALWMDLYHKEKWCQEMGEMYSIFQEPILRVIPAEKSLPSPAALLPFESITEIIDANRDLITIRNCCCRRGANNCHHPLDVCMQFKSRSENDLYRGSGWKVSADEAVSIALTSVGAGLVPTVTNVSLIDKLEFICFCCSCACLVLDPGLKAGTLSKILAPSRYEAKINYQECNGCKHCEIRCQFGAIEMKPIPGHDSIKAVLDPDKCLGCGVCELACVPGAITMEQIRPEDFVPEGVADEAILHF